MNKVNIMPSPPPAPLLQAQPPMSQYQQLAQAMSPPAGGAASGVANGFTGGALGTFNLAQLSQMLQRQQGGAAGPSYTGANGPFGNQTPGGLAVGGGSQSFAS